MLLPASPPYLTGVPLLEERAKVFSIASSRDLDQYSGKVFYNWESTIVMKMLLPAHGSESKPLLPS